MNRSAKTADEIFRVFRRLSAASGPEVAERWLEAKGYPEAAASARKARKKAVKTAQEAAEVRAITEVYLRSQAAARITEAQSAGQAPAATEVSEGVLAIGAGMRSPFWRSPAVTEAANAAAPEPSKPLHEMDAEEFRAHSVGAFGAYGRAAGHSSPIWD